MFVLNICVNIDNSINYDVTNIVDVTDTDVMDADVDNTDTTNIDVTDDNTGPPAKRHPNGVKLTFAWRNMYVQFSSKFAHSQCRESWYIPISSCCVCFKYYWKSMFHVLNLMLSGLICIWNTIKT